jgi:hypothetical protein
MCDEVAPTSARRRIRCLLALCGRKMAGVDNKKLELFSSHPEQCQGKSVRAMDSMSFLLIAIESPVQQNETIPHDTSTSLRITLSKA